MIVHGKANKQVDSLVMVQVVAIEEMGAYVKLVRLPSCSGGVTDS